jgi:hypothetical protein
MKEWPTDFEEVGPIFGADGVDVSSAAVDDSYGTIWIRICADGEKKKEPKKRRAK